MKRVVLAIAAASVLIALPAAAQYTDSSSSTTTTATAPSTGITTTGTDPVQEERTNPTVPTHGPNSGLTASGSVVSWNDDEVVLRTSIGITHFKLMPNTSGATSFTEGQRVTIDFTRNEQGVLIAKQIRSEGVAVTNPPGITTSGAAEAGAAVGAAVDNVGEAIEEGVEETAGADVDNDGTIGTRGGMSGTDDTASTTTTTTTGVAPTTTVDTDATTTSLPATGSKAPLFGLLGLLALGGAAAVRRLS